MTHYLTDKEVDEVYEELRVEQYIEKHLQHTHQSREVQWRLFAMGLIRKVLGLKAEIAELKEERTR